MTAPVRVRRRLTRLARAFARDRRGATSVELAFLAFPFILMILAVMQVGFYYMTQMALNAGTVQAEESLHAVFATGASPNTPSASSLKSTIVTGSSGGLTVTNLAVEVRPLANLDSGAVAISDGTTNYGSAWTPLVLRAKYSFPTFMPLMGTTWVVYSSAIVRRQGQ